MRLGIQFRLAAFASAIVVAALLMGWAANTTWGRFEQLQSMLTPAQIASFQTGDHFRATLQELDKTVAEYKQTKDEKVLPVFHKGLHDLNDWIDVQRPTLRINEKEILNRIDHAYDQYMDSATNLITSLQKGDISRADKHQQNLQAVSQQLLNLGYELVSAHSDSMEQFLKQSRHSLTVFLRLFFGSLLFLIGALAWLAMIVYREMIMPLRMKLVETHAIIERQEKLASLGMLAAGVAHEIRNPLTAIKAWLFIQQKNLRSGTPEHSDAVLIGDEINRLERIVKDFLVFARPSDPEFSVVPADQPLLESSTLLRPQLAKSNIQLNIEPSPRAFIRVDAQQIKQVLLNLIQNSAESIAPTGGTINLRVRLDSMRLGERLREVVILEVSDTGKGIAPDIEKRLFDPFFTTKESGTGLGLSIAARIVEKHGGALQYQTQVNRGTVFGIVLPRATP